MFCAIQSTNWPRVTAYQHTPFKFGNTILTLQIEKLWAHSLAYILQVDTPLELIQMEKDTSIEMHGLQASKIPNYSSISLPQSQQAPEKNVFQCKPRPNLSSLIEQTADYEKKKISATGTAKTIVGFSTSLSLGVKVLVLLLELYLFIVLVQGLSQDPSKPYLSLV